jgi:colicin import membrane protein
VYKAQVTKQRAAHAKLASTAARHAAAKRLRGGNTRGEVVCKPTDTKCFKVKALRRIALAKLRKADALRRIALAKRTHAKRLAEAAKAKARRTAVRRKKLLLQRRKRAAQEKRAAAARRRIAAAKKRKRAAIAKALRARDAIHKRKIEAMIRKIFHWKGKIPKSLGAMKTEDLGKIVRYMRKNMGWQTVTNRKRSKKELSGQDKRHILNYYKYYLSFSGGVGPWW